MTETPRDLVIVMTKGTDHELSSVAFTIANGGLTAGLIGPVRRASRLVATPKTISLRASQSRAQAQCTR
jgi:hypothetical protein